MTVEIANSLNREERLHAELVQNERRETIETAPGEIAPENSQIAPAGDDCREKLMHIRNVIDSWEKAARHRNSGVQIQWHQLQALLKIIDG